jgi:hypothetical protein
MQLVAGPNRLSTGSPTTIRVPGGSATVGRVLCKDIFTSGKSIKTSLTVNPIDLQPLISGIWPEASGGKIQGNLDPILFEGNALATAGEIRAKAFGGEIILSELGASGIFTAAPVFRLNARWEDIVLSEITTGTSFGKIEGILGGDIRDLEIAYGQPQRFDLLIETVKKKGVSQKISVKALDNIARIGGGQSPFMGLAGAFASFFKEFSYNKIGMRASLENDVFRINGTVKEGGVEYLVKKGGLSGVNVVNQSPDNRISFKDMVKRIKRVTASKTGPVLR